MDLKNPQISQHVNLSGGSDYKPGETFVGNAGFFSAETCNKIAYGNTSAASSSQAGIAKNLAKFA